MQRNNLLYLLSYILILLFFIVDGLFFRQSFIALFIIFLIILPIISIFILKRISRKIDIKINTKTASILINNNIIVNLLVTNKSIFPILNANIHFTVNNLFYPNQEKSIVSLALNPKRTNQLYLSFLATHCGMVEVSFDSICLTDYLHLYSITIPISSTEHIPVFPEETGFKWNYTIPENFENDEDDNFVQYGTATHDLKETREYQPGDSLKNIHWKLSSKTDNLTVKVFETSADKTILLLPELTQENLDNTLDTLFNFSLFLIKQKEFFKILIFSAYKKEFDEIIISTYDDVTRALLALYQANSYDMKQYALTSYYEQYEKCIIHISSKTMNVTNKEGIISTLTTREDY